MNKQLEKLTTTEDTFILDDLCIKKISELNYIEEKSLPSRYKLIATSKSTTFDKSNYKDAPIGICLFEPTYHPELDDLWALSELDKRSNLINNMKYNLELNNNTIKSEITLNSVKGNLSTLYAVANICEPDEDYWISYTFMIFHERTLYTGMIYINCLETGIDNTNNVVKQLLDCFTSTGKTSTKNITNRQSNMFGEYGHDNGKIDAIKLNNLFFEDVLFNNPEEIQYDGTKHYITGLQFEASKIQNYPVIYGNYSLFGIATKEVMNHLEENKELVIEPYEYHKNFTEVTKSYPITGLIYLLFSAWHMIKINEISKNEYQAFIDENLIKGLPHGYSKLMEYIKTLRTYNDLNEDFTVTFIGTFNFDGPTGMIQNHVTNSDTFKSYRTIKYSELNKETEKRTKKDIENKDEEKILEKTTKSGIDIKILKYLNYEAEQIKKDIESICNEIEHNQKELEKSNDINELKEKLIELRIDEYDYKNNFSYREISGNGVITYSRKLDQLKVDNEVLEYTIDLEYTQKEEPKNYLKTLLEQLSTKSLITIKKELSDLVKEYIDDNKELSLTKEMLYFNSTIYDYDNMDTDFKEEDYLTESQQVELQKQEEKENKIASYLMQLISESQTLDTENELKKIEKYKEKIQKEINDELEKEKEEYNKNIDTIKENSKKIRLQKMGENRDLVARYDKLYFFETKKKQELENKIRSNNQEIENIEKRISNIEQERANGIQKIEETSENNFLKKEALIIYPPYQMDVINYVKELMQNPVENSQVYIHEVVTRNDLIKIEILDALETFNQPRTVTEIMTKVPYSSAKISALLKLLVEEGKVKKIEDGGKVYFTLTNKYKFQNEMNYLKDIDIKTEFSILRNKIYEYIQSVGNNTDIIKSIKDKFNLNEYRIFQILYSLKDDNIELEYNDTFFKLK